MHEAHCRPAGVQSYRTDVAALQSSVPGTACWHTILEGNRSVFRKIKGALGDREIRYVEKLSSGIKVTTAGAGNYEQRGQLIDNLMVAIEDRKVALIVYQSMQATEPVEQEVYPLA